MQQWEHGFAEPCYVQAMQQIYKLSLFFFSCLPQLLLA